MEDNRTALYHISYVNHLLKENTELRSENLILKGQIHYLEKDKIPWLERQIHQARTPGWKSKIKDWKE